MVNEQALVFKESEAASAIHDALDDFDFIDDAFNESIAVISRNSVHHSVDVLFQSVDKSI